MSDADRPTAASAVLWLGLVRQRFLRRVAGKAEGLMTAAERMKLLDAAMRSRDAGAYLTGIHDEFDDAGRKDDALIVAVLRTLIRAGEIEAVMRMRADWMRGGNAALPNPDLGL